MQIVDANGPDRVLIGVRSPATAPSWPLREGCSVRRRAIRPFRSGFGHGNFAGHLRAEQDSRGLIRFAKRRAEPSAIRHHYAQGLSVFSPRVEQEG
jgi:hypothetical protein